MASLKEQQRLLYETQKLEISRLRQVLDLQSGLQSEIHSILVMNQIIASSSKLLIKVLKDYCKSALQTAGRDVDMFSKALSLTETRVMAMNVMIFEGSEAVSDLHTQMVSKIDTLTLDLTHNLTEAVHDFENKSLGAWSGMEQVIQLWQSNFQDEMSLILQHARSEIEMTALQSRGRLEDLDQLIDSVHSKHLAVFGFLKRLYEYLGAFQGNKKKIMKNQWGEH
ncbi:hypothetical protein BGW38_006744 [Lunasporangiospora selenospora]|uniref:Uncharacterized protein n=1 Tax=Lunasporangiospora selenospora TaxID=979761 RepID=A0A9P6G132_9FUNG|nr:hypothetical protein BGW38_006744 [Lunasporangiospora selenospora]